MSILSAFLVGSFAACVGLAVALAFARAALYANVLTELDRAHGLPRGLHSPRTRPAAGKRSSVVDLDDAAPIRPDAPRTLARPSSL